MQIWGETLVGFFLVLTRVSAFFLVAPVFSWKSIPMRVKAGLILLLSIFFAGGVAFDPDQGPQSPLGMVLWLFNEALYGIGLGLIAMIIFSTVKLAGRIIERQMGLALAQVLDPLTGESGQPLGMLMEMIFIILFLSAGGHHLLLRVINQSYISYPPGTLVHIGDFCSGIIQAGSVLLIAGLRLAAPMLAVFLILLVLLAILARIAPEMNILFISLPLRVGMGLLMMIVFFGFINEFVKEFSNWMGKLLPL